MGRRLTKEQDDLLKVFLKGDKAKAEGVEESVIEAAKNFTDEFVATSEEYQAAFQYMGNLRNEAIGNGHVENSGWALHKDIGGGRKMYIASGVEQARAHGYGDFNKLDQNTKDMLEPFREGWHRKEFQQ